MKIVYIGPRRGVSIDRYGVINQPRGKPFELPDAVAKKFIEQSPTLYEAVTDKPVTTTASKTKSKKGGEQQ